MLYSEQVTNEFYQSLGKLFYAVAFSDKKVQDEEVQALSRDIREYWVQLDEVKDEFGTDAAYQIEIVFDWLESTTLTSEELFDEFKAFYFDHLNFFNPEVKSLVMRTANDIASSFAGKNKAELIFLSRLAKLFSRSREHPET